ncbi:hypothetical protein Tco_0396741 [Tanacetum coccineum]
MICGVGVSSTGEWPTHKRLPKTVATTHARKRVESDTKITTQRHFLTIKLNTKCRLHFVKASSHQRYKTSGSSSFNTESGDASINLNVDVGNEEEDKVQELRRPMGRNKAKGLKKKVHNEHAIEMKKEECLAFLEIKRREVECHEQELAMQGYRQRQEDIRFYM